MLMGEYNRVAAFLVDWVVAGLMPDPVSGDRIHSSFWMHLASCWHCGTMVACFYRLRFATTLHCTALHFIDANSALLMKVSLLLPFAWMSAFVLHILFLFDGEPCLFQLSVDWLDADAMRALVELQCEECNVVVYIWHRQEQFHSLGPRFQTSFL